MKKAFLVLGPESSGTRLLAQLLMDAGCFGDAGHEQRLDRLDDPSLELLDESALPGEDKPIVWRRSFPHAERWVDISRAVQQLRFLEYEVWAVITARDWFPMTQSQQKKHGHVPDTRTAMDNVRKAYQTIFSRLPPDVPFVMASYESICRFQYDAVRKLLEMLQLPAPVGTSELDDGNVKWYYSTEK